MQCPPTSPGQRQEIPFCACGLQDRLGIDVHPVEDHHQFVDERDVQVALHVLDHLRGLSHADRGRLVGAGGDDRAVEIINSIGDLRGRAGRHLADVRQTVRLVAGIDPLGRVAAEEILVEGQTRDALQHRHAVFLGGTGINRAFIDHDITRFEYRAHILGRLKKRREIGALVRINGRGHGHDVDARGTQRDRVIGDCKGAQPPPAPLM